MKNEILTVLRLITNAPPCAKRVYRALKIFDSAEDIFSADKGFLLGAGFKEGELSTFLSAKTGEEEKVLEYCEKNGIKIITYYSDEYPRTLRELDEPPAALFVKGELPPVDSLPTLGIVGTRDCTTYGGKFAAALAYDLSASGFVTVSGMARGIDTYAHKGALLAGGITVAVLPSGVDIPTPSGNTELYHRICEKGAVISEHLPGRQCRAYDFHMRNRLISGISQGIAVIETGKKGGSMITVRHATEQGKLIFAVPGSPGSTVSEGTNALIRDGASVCTGNEDILAEYEVLFGTEFIRPKKNARIKVDSEPPSAEKKPREKNSRERKPLQTEAEAVPVPETKPPSPIPSPMFYGAFSEKEMSVLEALKDGPLSVDSVCDVTGLIFPKAVTILNALEMNGYLEALPGGMYGIREK